VEQNDAGNKSSANIIVPLVETETPTMADDKTKTDSRDRSKVAGGEDYEVAYLSEKAGITPAQARELIKRYGNNREKLMEHAKNLA